MTKKPKTTVGELIKYLETLDPEAIVKVIEEIQAEHSYPKEVDLDLNEGKGYSGNLDYYEPTFQFEDRPKTLTLGYTSYS